MQTHNTTDCRKWNADDTSKFKSNKRDNYKSNNDHVTDGNMKECFAQNMCKDLKKDMKKKFKSKKNKKSQRRIMTLFTLVMTVTPTRMMGPAIVVSLLK